MGNSSKYNNQGAGLQINDCKVSLKSVTLSSSKFKQISNNPFHISIGATGDKYCPVKALHDYQKLRGNNGGPLFFVSNKIL